MKRTAPADLSVEVAYAGPEGQWLLRVAVPAGATVGDAIAASRIAEQLPALEITDLNVGVFSQTRTLASPLRDGDRVEIYRPLLVDPKVARRLRAAKASKR